MTLIIHATRPPGPEPPHPDRYNAVTMSLQAIGNYRILGELGRGAMGIVYHGQDGSIGRPVAIKVIRIEPGASADHGAQLRHRLVREASAAGNLSHPGIVTVYQLGEEGADVFIVMEFVPGRSLEHILVNGPAVDHAVALDFLRQIADALDYAHRAGVVHRDVKPANILIRDDGRVKVADFGIAKITQGTDSALTAAGTSLGSPAYMSPEQVRAQQVDGRSDQFSLAIIAYQMLTGRMPFVAETAHALMYQIVSIDPFSTADPQVYIPPPVAAVLRRALAKDPNDRYPTCSAFLDDLTAACGGSVAATTQIPPQPQVADPPPSNRSTLFASLLIGILLIAAAGTYWFVKLRPDTDPVTQTSTDNPLVKAVAEGRLDEAKALLAKGADINGANADGTTALMQAAEGSAYMPNNGPAVAMLLERHPQVDAQDKRGRTALLRAAAEGKDDALRLLLAAKADPNHKSTEGSTPLLTATTYGRISSAKLLLDAGAQVDLADAAGSTPLMIASEGTAYLPNNLPLAEVFLDRKAALETQDSRGRTALYRAAAEGKTDVVRALLARKANPNAKASNGSTPLIEAVTFGRASTVPILLEGGAEIDLADAAGDTPLMIASEGTSYMPDNVPLVTALLAAKANVDLQDTRGRSPLYRAAAEGKEDAMRLLLDRKANPNQKAADGTTPLIEAVTYGRLGAATALIDRGAAVDLANAAGNTPLMIAAETSPYIKAPAEFINMLLLKGAKASAKDDRGRTALMRATESNNAAAIEILQNK
ncbi:MAG: ankyrin repeat domain-containing protein [Bryobacteraceae bacterium]